MPDDDVVGQFASTDLRAVRGWLSIVRCVVGRPPDIIGDLELLRLHDLRHTAATQLLERGVHPKVVQEMLGHSTITLTLDTYSHVMPGLHASAAKEMQRLFEDPDRQAER